MTEFFFISLIAFLGFPIGVFLSWWIKEEVKPGVRYFFLTMILAVSVYLYAALARFSVYFAGFAALAFLILSLMKPQAHITWLVFPLLGLALFIATTPEQGLLMGSLTFLYGMTAAGYASLRYPLLKNLLVHAPYVAIVILIGVIA
ncbi:hypothetical protein J4464_00790 [Candidatus Woesearchaeota archaeon]|nr:hypothetical protein [Candidatus Woesearchaeota archaeon]